MDKLEQVKKEIERRRDIFRTSVASIDGCKANVLTDILYFIDSLQEEPVSKPIDFEKELYKAFDQVKDFTLGIRIAKWFYNMGKNSQEPVNEKKCMFTKDIYTDEDRKVLCEDCKERCEYSKKEEPVSKDFEMALAEMIDKAQKNVIEPWVVAAQWKDELIELVKSEEPVSEKLEEAARRYAALQAGMKDAMTSEFYEEYPYSPNDVNAFKAGAEWQREQMLSEEKK